MSEKRLDGLSVRQRKVLAFVVQYLVKHHIPPTFREIGNACGISSVYVVSYQLRELVRLGFLEYAVDGRGLSRNLRVVGSRLEMPDWVHFISAVASQEVLDETVP